MAAKGSLQNSFEDAGVAYTRRMTNTETADGSNEYRWIGKRQLD